MKHNANELTRFHANWQRATAREDDRSPDAQLADIQGQGRYVGTSLHVYQVIDGIWWGEGDEKIFIDGEKYPSWFGTGSEDYFGYAWCDSTEFDFPYNGQPWNKDTIYSGDRQLQERGDKINYRIHGGNGSQFIAKLNGTICLVDGKDWIDAEGGKVTVQIARKDGGDLTITISGSQAVLELKAAVAENNENLELGLYRGEARHENIAVSEVDPGEDPGGDVPETGDEPLLPALLLMLLSIVAAVALRTKKKKIV